jgi:uncharacterized protein
MAQLDKQHGVLCSRRELLASASAAALFAPFQSGPAFAAGRSTASPVDASFVALRPSPFADAVAANRRYLLSLDPERLLHNFHVSAGLQPKGTLYGGWESQGIAGHSLGHWLSAVSLRIANGGDAELATQLDHALVEMARIQAAHGDGYLGGTTVSRDGKDVDGKVVFEEVHRGEIHSPGWALNGGWVPIYTWHKVHAGLLDAHRLAGNPRALPIALGMADYLGRIVEQLNDEQVQRVLNTEHGGINEAYAETYALTGDRRWLAIAEKLRHKAVLDPLTRQEDRLAGLHANTQIPKLVGLARLHELTGDPAHAAAARFFHTAVVNRHSYVIGGNSEREHFGEPGQLQGTLTTATCESCNSYNMLKLTRHLFGWEPRAELFDYYERVQLNHMLAHQRPDDGRFVYFMPLAPGATRTYSEPENSFWCCVGTGMESHAKHADSIYWHDDTALYVNLYIPSTLDWPERGLRLTLDTAYPMDGAVRLTVDKAPPRAAALALRIPRWATGATLTVNGAPAPVDPAQGYARITRRWRARDRVELTLPMTLRAEPLLGDPQTIAFLSGPLVLAADMGPAGDRTEEATPAIITEDGIGALNGVEGEPHHFRTTTALGRELELKPYFPLYDRRTAVYFRKFTPAQWAASKDAFLAEEAARLDLIRRTVDVFHIGEMQPERDHGLEATGGSQDVFYGRHKRTLPPGETMRFRMARRPVPSALRVTYIGFETDRTFEIWVDGQRVAVERRPGPGGSEWVEVDYPLPPTSEAQSAIEFRAIEGSAVIYGVRVIQLPEA